MARIAAPLADEFEDSEFTVPCQKLEEAGHEIVVIGTRANSTVTGKRGESQVAVQRTADTLYPADFDGLLKKL
jgi:protease I